MRGIISVLKIQGIGVPMEVAFGIFLVCILGCSYQSYRSGFTKGTEATLAYLEEEGVIEFKEK